MNNKEYLFNEISDEELAFYFIQKETRNIWNPVLDKEEPTIIYIAPNGTEWFIWDDVVNATIDWLNEEY